MTYGGFLNAWSGLGPDAERRELGTRTDGATRCLAHLCTTDKARRHAGCARTAVLEANALSRPVLEGTSGGACPKPPTFH
eukprot:4255196-Pyramimonas_sp.AAC.1